MGAITKALLVLLRVVVPASLICLACAIAFGAYMWPYSDFENKIIEMEANLRVWLPTCVAIAALGPAFAIVFAVHDRGNRLLLALDILVATGSGAIVICMAFQLY